MKYRKFTEEEKAFINANYLLMPIKTLCKEIQRSSFGVNNYLRRMNLIIPQDIIAERKKNSRFQKGCSPTNKGKKQVEFMTAEGIEKCKATRFQKGSVPPNKKPLGYERITVDGYTEVKMEEPNIFKLKHRVIFESYHNIVLEASDIIRFRDGNKQNFELENLYKVDNAMHLQENRFSDSAIAKKMSGKNEDLKKALLQQPELIELKRTQYKLTKEFKKHERE